MAGQETGIIRAIEQFLAYQKGVYYVRVGSGAIVLTQGARQRFFKSGKKGCPDLLICCQGKFIGCEVKSAKGRQSEAQIQAQADIEKSGGQYWLVRGVDEVEAKLRQFKT